MNEQFTRECWKYDVTDNSEPLKCSVYPCSGENYNEVCPCNPSFKPFACPHPCADGQSRPPRQKDGIMKIDMTIFEDTPETRAFLKALNAKIIETQPLRCIKAGPGAYSLGGFILELSENAFNECFYEMEDLGQFFPHEDIAPETMAWHSSTLIIDGVPKCSRVINGLTRKMIRDEGRRIARNGR